MNPIRGLEPAGRSYRLSRTESSLSPSTSLPNRAHSTIARKPVRSADASSYTVVTPSLHIDAPEGLELNNTSHLSGVEYVRLEGASPLSSQQTAASSSLLDKSRRSSQSSGVSQKLHDAQENIKHIAEPEDHNHCIGDDEDLETSRKWRGRRQRRRLWRLIVAEWVATVFLCLLYGIILTEFQRRPSIGPGDQGLFNASTTGVAFLLGVNLTSSLKTYAKMMRWRLLSLRYRPLAEFELILACEGLRNVAKLMWKARGKKFPFCSFTSLICFLWLFLNLCLALLVASIGLTYSLDQSPLFNQLRAGRVSFTNFAALQINNDDFGTSGVNMWGIRGLNARTTKTPGAEHAKPYQVLTYGNGSSSYYLQNFNPHDFNTSVISKQQIRSDVQCEEFEVTGDGFENVDFWDNFTYATKDPSYPSKFTTFQWLNAPGFGGLTVWADMNSTCGPRCTSMYFFIARVNTSQPGAIMSLANDQYFECNNTVRVVREVHDGIELEAFENSSVNDVVAGMLAGAMGWSDNPMSYSKYRLLKSISYSRMTKLVSTLHNATNNQRPNETQMADFVSTFSTKAAAAIDDINTGLGEFAYDEHGMVPVASHRLTVDWCSAGGLLGGMAFGQFAAMVFLFIFAAQVVIKDDSPLSMAKLLFSLIRDRGLGDHGCMLKGEDIIDEMQNPNVVYGWIDNGKHDEATGRLLGHIDVFVAEPGKTVHLQNARGKIKDHITVTVGGQERVVHTDFKRTYAYD